MKVLTRLHKFEKVESRQKRGKFQREESMERERRMGLWAAINLISSNMIDGVIRIILHDKVLIGSIVEMEPVVKTKGSFIKQKKSIADCLAELMYSGKSFSVQTYSGSEFELTVEWKLAEKVVPINGRNRRLVTERLAVNF